MKNSVQIWILACLCLIASIVIVGGATRLTGSGLSMVDWEPIMGIMPPLSADAWSKTFNDYKQSPEYQLINNHMTLSEFKTIFFWEYGHRILGRMIGLLAIIPFIFFWIKGKLSNRFIKRWSAIIILILCQGLMGWYMVKSGLIDTPHVSHFRLAAHLLLALIIFTIIFWEWLHVTFNKIVKRKKSKREKMVLITFFAILFQIMYGAFTAGLHAGYFYNTYPKMGSEWLPESAFMYSQSILTNALTNPILIQWIHRWFAIVVVILVFLIWLDSKREPEHYYQKACKGLVLAVIIQFILGIFTLLKGVWLPIALAHQSGGLLLVVAITSTLYFSRYSISNDSRS